MIARLLLLLPLLALASSLSLADDAKKVDPTDGTWLPASGELGGKPFPEAVLKSMKLVVDGDKYLVTVGKTDDSGTVKRDTKAKPARMEITGTEGPNKGKTILAIYELDGDTMRLCYELTGKAYPTEFKSTEGTQLFLVTYKRAKK